VSAFKVTDDGDVVAALFRLKDRKRRKRRRAEQCAGCSTTADSSMSSRPSAGGGAPTLTHKPTRRSASVVL